MKKIRQVEIDGLPFELCEDTITLHTKDSSGEEIILTCRQAIKDKGTNVLVYEVQEVTGDPTLYINKAITIENTIAVAFMELKRKQNLTTG